MKKWFIVLFVFFYMQTTAQNAELRKYPLTTVSDVAGFSVLNILDSYLSPLTYSGMAIFYERTGQKLFSPENTSVSMQGRFRTLAGLTLNPQNTTSITYLGAGYSWGAYYHFQITNELRLQAGSLIDAGFAVKQNARNVNNPYNFDLATNLNLSANANYDIATKRRTIRVSFGFETPLMGCMFVPESGMSYYELFGLKNYTNAVHFSSLHNKQGLSVHTSIEIPFKYSTWKFGIGSNELKYKANDMVFKHNEYMLLIGLKYNLYRFIGTKNSAPENFISTYK